MVYLCQAFVDYPEYVCPLLPAGVPCSCPLKADTYHNPSAEILFDEEWLGYTGGVDVRPQFPIMLNTKLIEFILFFLVSKRVITLLSLK